MTAIEIHDAHLGFEAVCVTAATEDAPPSAVAHATEAAPLFAMADADGREAVARDIAIGALGAFFDALIWCSRAEAAAHAIRLAFDSVNAALRRCYRLRGEELSLLTHDHSFAAERRGLEADGVPLAPEIAARWEHVLTRSVRGGSVLQVDSFTVPAERGDQFLLCSDGPWGSVAATEIASILREATDATDACKRLVSAAWAAGGLDNIGVAVMRVR
jgi:hypothetical protein